MRNAALAYYEAMASGDGEGLRALFDPQAHFHGLRDGAEVRRDLPAFVDMVEGPGADPEREVP
ncbi:MAG: nuclear transport factor 2 family protein [Sphingomonas sp.]